MKLLFSGNVNTKVVVIDVRQRKLFLKKRLNSSWLVNLEPADFEDADELRIRLNEIKQMLGIDTIDQEENKKNGVTTPASLWRARDRKKQETKMDVENNRNPFKVFNSLFVSTQPKAMEKEDSNRYLNKKFHTDGKMAQLVVLGSVCAALEGEAGRVGMMARRMADR